MNKNSVLKSLHEKFPGFQLKGQYLFSRDYAQILRGVCIEWVPGGVYVWDFWYPLFDDFGGFNLLYSSRLKENGGYLSLAGMLEKEVSDAIYRMVAPLRDAFKCPASLSEFISLFDQDNGLIRNHYALMILARAEVLSGLFDQALIHLGQSVDFLDPQSEKACIELISKIKENPSHAIEYVNGIELFVKNDLGLAHSLAM